VFYDSNDIEKTWSSGKAIENRIWHALMNYLPHDGFFERLGRTNDYRPPPQPVLGPVSAMERCRFASRFVVSRSETMEMARMVRPIPMSVHE